MRHKWRQFQPRAVFLFLLCLISIFYLWLLICAFAPASIPIDLHHLTQLRYVINSDACPQRSDVKGGDDIYMLVLVGSHPSHVAVRDVIRRTWGNPRISKYPFKLAFIFGKLTDGSQNEALEYESRKYGDIVQGDFVDSYYNVTLRDLMGFRWAWQFCPRAKYVMRADDDIALDIYKLIEVLEERFEAVRSDSIGCYEVVRGAIPRRYGRYAVSNLDYGNTYYADYCMGWMYVVTPTVAKRLVDMAVSTRPIWINDVHITGTLAKLLDLHLVNIQLKHTLEYKDMVHFAKHNQNVDFQLGPTRGEAELTFQIQEIYRKRATLRKT